MSWNASLTNLRSALAMLYPTVDDARRVVADAGLNINFIAFDHKAINNWYNILTEAEKRNKVEAILQVVHNEYGENPEIIRAYQAYLGTIEQRAAPSSSGPSPARATQASVGRVQPIKILFLAANPLDTVQLRLSEEARAIDQALHPSQFRDRFDIEQHWAVRYNDLQALLLRHQPTIVHFSGHGSDAGEIILQDDNRVSHPVSSRALGRLFAILKDNIRCVVLNACYSEPQAQAIAQQIDVVIGMSKDISDQASINFASAFYQALGYGRSVQTAFDLGCIQIDLDNLSEQDTPRLLTPRSNPAKIIFATETPATSPGSDAGSGKYNINIGNAKGVVIGDNAQATQNFESIQDNTDEEGMALQQLLGQHQRNLLRLQSKKAVYAAGEEPLSLLNQIEYEEQEIKRIQAVIKQRF